MHLDCYFDLESDHSQGKPNFHTRQLPLSAVPCNSVSVLKAHPMVSLVADIRHLHVFKGGHICFRLKAKSIEANPAACALISKAGLSQV